MHQTQRVKSSGYLPSRVTNVDLTQLNLNSSFIPIPSTNTTREHSLHRRVKELEEEVRHLKIENDKQVRHVPSNQHACFLFGFYMKKEMISKFRERWDKLKESAKQKKLAKATAAMKEMREQCIDEDPEAEAAATESTTV
jgi:hypothetical protein